MRNSFLWSSYLVDDSQLGLLWLVKNAIFIIKVDYLPLFLNIFVTLVALLSFWLLFNCLLDLRFDGSIPFVPVLRFYSFIYVLLIYFRNNYAHWIGLTYMLVHWFYALCLVDHMSHIYFVYLFEIRVHIWRIWLLKLLLRLKNFLSLLGCLFASNNFITKRVLKLAGL